GLAALGGEDVVGLGGVVVVAGVVLLLVVRAVGVVVFDGVALVEAGRLGGGVVLLVDVELVVVVGLGAGRLVQLVELAVLLTGLVVAVVHVVAAVVVAHLRHPLKVVVGVEDNVRRAPNPSNPGNGPRSAGGESGLR